MNNDLKYAWRQLIRARGFAAVAIVTLAIGIGATTAMFAQLDAIFLDPLPVAAPDALRSFAWTTRPTVPRRYSANGRFSYPAYVLVRDHARSFSDVACWSGAYVNVPTLGRLETQIVSGNYFHTLGAAPALGRTIVPSDDTDSPVAVISDDLWRRGFGRDPDVVQKSIGVNGTRLTIVGVMPAGFFGLNPNRSADLYVSLPMYSQARFEVTAPRQLDDARDWSACEVVARLRPGVTDAAARADVLAVLRDAESDPATVLSQRPQLIMANVSRGTDDLRIVSATTLPLLIGAAILMLCLACANIAALLLARVPARVIEIATRMAIGAAAGRIVRQLTLEGLLLAGIAAVPGVLLAQLLNRVMPGVLANVSAGGADVQRVQATLDWRVLAFASAAAVITGVIFGLAPAVTLLPITRRLCAGHVPRLVSRRTPATRQTKVLVAVQAALSVALLVPAGLLTHNVGDLRNARVDPEPERILYFGVAPGLSGYRGPRIQQLVDASLQRLTGDASVDRATAFQPARWCAAPGRPRQELPAAVAASPAYFGVEQLPMLAGRSFGEADDQGPPAAIVNRAFADRYLTGSPLGQLLWACPRDGARTVIGVVADRPANPRLPAAPTVYLPFAQAAAMTTGTTLSFAVRTRGPASTATPAVRAAFEQAASDLPLFDVETGVSRIDRLLAFEQTVSRLLVLFGVIAVMLSCIGLHGVLAYAVQRRTAEVGIRVAIGATPLSVVHLIVGESLLPLGLGLIAGGALSLAASRSGLLYGTSSLDPVTVAGACVLFIAASLLAAAVPALRATRIAPSRALRVE